jgi:5-methylcytosine-specific restriction endonuclease McrA
MMITYEDFIQAVQENDGEVLATAGGQATFLLERTNQGVSFTPESSGKPRQLNRGSVERYLEFFNKTQSIKTSDYSERHRNQSYVLAIIKLILGQQPNAPVVDDGINEEAEIDPEFNAPEGSPTVRSHRRRERSRELVRMAKAVFRQKHGRLFCLVCEFDFGRTDGEPDFIEVHHLIPLCDLKAGHKTKLSDLAMVCSNCHRMLHRGSPWPTIEALRKTISRCGSAPERRRAWNPNRGMKIQSLPPLGPFPRRLDMLRH